jgi:division protein CdvB (Snf7/Vps24/ESCRT-III family)
MPFANKWEKKEESPGFVSRLRDTIKTPVPLKVQLDGANRQVKVLVSQLDGTINRIKQRDSTIFKQVVTSLAKHDTAHAAVYANELAEVRKMGTMVTQAQLALEQISLRLGTISDMGEIATTLAPAVTVMKNMKMGLQTVLPEADKEIGEISGLLSSILIDASATGGVSLNFDAANEEAQRVLDEASVVAEQRMKESFPEIPTTVFSERQQEDLAL